MREEVQEVEKHFQEHQLHIPVLDVIRMVDVLNRNLVRMLPEHGMAEKVQIGAMLLEFIAVGLKRVLPYEIRGRRHLAAARAALRGLSRCAGPRVRSPSRSLPGRNGRGSTR